jgi:predicted transposase YdaD
MPARMANYRLRLHFRFPHLLVRQIVIYLKPTGSALVHESVFEISGMRHEFEVVRLWEQPVQTLMQAEGLLPFAILGDVAEREVILREVAKRTEQIAQAKVRSNVLAATAVLAGLVVDKELIQQVLRSDVMKESVIYQDILQQGLQQGELTTILRQLGRKFGRQMNAKRRDRIEKLSLQNLENLTEAILDFQSVRDLDLWLSGK